MKLSLIPVLSVIALTAGISPAPAFEAAPNDEFPAGTLSTKLADPDDIVQDMARRYTGNSATIAHFGNTTIGIVGPGSSYTGTDGPFLPDPAAGTVMSKREW
jgi:hypothetical protein